MHPIPFTLPAALRALALTGEQDNCAQIPGPLQVLLLHILALLFARPAHAHAHAIWLFCVSAPRISPALAACLALLGYTPDTASAPRPSARRRGANEIIIALAHCGPPRNPSRPARMPPTRPRQARDPPRQTAIRQSATGTGLARPANARYINFVIGTLP